MICTFFIVASLIWGSVMMKAIVYCHISSEKVSDRPMNMLIILDQIIHHATNTFFSLAIILKVKLEPQKLNRLNNLRKLTYKGYYPICILYIYQKSDYGTVAGLVNFFIYLYGLV